MRESRFDTLTRAFDRRSRRRLLGALSGTVALGPLAVLPAMGAKRRGNKKRKEKGNKKSVCPTCPPPPPSSPPVAPLELAYACPGPAPTDQSGTGDTRLAQSFVAWRTGTLRQIQVAITKGSGTGDYRLQLVKVNAGTPSNSPLDVLAATTILNGSVPSGQTTLTGEFAGPMLVQGTAYAVVISRPGGSNLTVHSYEGEGDDCSGEFFHASGGEAFISDAVFDLVVSVLVV